MTRITDSNIRLRFYFDRGDDEDRGAFASFTPYKSGPLSSTVETVSFNRKRFDRSNGKE